MLVWRRRRRYVLWHDSAEMTSREGFQIDFTTYMCSVRSGGGGGGDSSGGF